MNYIVIVKTAAEIPVAPDCPVICKTFPTEAEAIAAYPGKKVMTVDAYNLYVQSFRDAYEAYVPKKSLIKRLLGL